MIDTSFQLLRTNPTLTTNIKIVVNSEYKLFLESFNVNKQLSNEKYKHYFLSSESRFETSVVSFYDGLPINLAFDVKYDNDNDIQYTNYDNQFDTTYFMGANQIEDQWYNEEFEYFAPLYLKPNSIPTNFIILRVDGPGVFNQENQTYDLSTLDKDNFRNEILDKWKIINLYDLSYNSNIGYWIYNNFVNNDLFPQSSFELDNKQYNFSRWFGIDYYRGVYTEKDLYLNDKLYYEQPHFKLEEYITDGFKNNGLIYPYILNFKFLFDDNPATPYTLNKYSINRYYGFYLEELDLIKKLTSYKTPLLKENILINNNVFVDVDGITPIYPFQLDLDFPQYIYALGDLQRVDRNVVSGNTYEYKIISDKNIEISDITDNGLVNINFNEFDNESYGISVEPQNVILEIDPYIDMSGVSYGLYGDLYLIDIDGKYHVLKSENVSLNDLNLEFINSGDTSVLSNITQTIKYNNYYYVGTNTNGIYVLDENYNILDNWISLQEIRELRIFENILIAATDFGRWNYDLLSLESGFTNTSNTNIPTNNVILNYRSEYKDYIVFIEGGNYKVWFSDINGDVGEVIDIGLNVIKSIYEKNSNIYIAYGTNKIRIVFDYNPLTYIDQEITGINQIKDIFVEENDTIYITSSNGLWINNNLFTKKLDNTNGFNFDDIKNMYQYKNTLYFESSYYNNVDFSFTTFGSPTFYDISDNVVNELVNGRLISTTPLNLKTGQNVKINIKNIYNSVLLNEDFDIYLCNSTGGTTSSSINITVYGEYILTSFSNGIHYLMVDTTSSSTDFYTSAEFLISVENSSFISFDYKNEKELFVQLNLPLYDNFSINNDDIVSFSLGNNITDYKLPFEQYNKYKYSIQTDYAIISNNNTLQYWIDDTSSEYYINKNIQNGNDKPLVYPVYRAKFLDIKDFDFDRVHTRFSDFDYEQTEYVETEEQKLYAIEYRDSAYPKRFKIIEEGQPYQFNIMNVSSEYISDDELWEIVNNDLSKIWRKNQSVVKWGYINSNGVCDYEYKLNNSNTVGFQFNREPNIFSNQTNELDKNLDYMYRIGEFHKNGELFHYKNQTTNIETGLMNDDSKKFNLEYYIKSDFDYFTYFFKNKQLYVDNNLEFIKETLKYSRFYQGDNLNPSNTLFKGVNYIIHKVVDVVTEEFEDNDENLYKNIIEIQTDNSVNFNDYKFSIIYNPAYDYIVGNKLVFKTEVEPLLLYNPQYLSTTNILGDFIGIKKLNKDINLTYNSLEDNIFIKEGKNILSQVLREWLFDINFLENYYLELYDFESSAVTYNYDFFDKSVDGNYYQFSGDSIYNSNSSELVPYELNASTNYIYTGNSFYEEFEYINPKLKIADLYEENIILGLTGSSENNFVLGYTNEFYNISGKTLLSFNVVNDIFTGYTFDKFYNLQTLLTDDNLILECDSYNVSGPGDLSGLFINAYDKYNFIKGDRIILKLTVEQSGVLEIDIFSFSNQSYLTTISSTPINIYSNTQGFSVEYEFLINSNINTNHVKIGITGVGSESVYFKNVRVEIFRKRNENVKLQLKSDYDSVYLGNIDSNLTGHTEIYLNSNYTFGTGYTIQFEEISKTAYTYLNLSDFKIQPLKTEDNLFVSLKNWNTNYVLNNYNDWIYQKRLYKKENNLLFNGGIFDLKPYINNDKNGIHVFLNKKYKNILIVLNQTIPMNIDYYDLNNITIFGEKYGFYNSKTLNGEDINYSFSNYNFTPSLITAFNFTEAINDLNNLHNFDQPVYYHIIDEDGKYAYTPMNAYFSGSTMNTLTNWDNNFPPYFLEILPPEELILKKNSYTVKALKGPNYNIYNKYRPSGFSSNKKYNINEPIARKIDLNEKELEIRPQILGENFTYDKNIFRYNGNYEPIFKDISLFNKSNYKVIDDEFLYYESNYRFDETYENFGRIDELMYSKVNPYTNILKLKNSLSDKSIYPMIDEYGYSYTSRFIFKSTWDAEFYYTTYDRQQNLT